MPRCSLREQQASVPRLRSRSTGAAVRPRWSCRRRRIRALSRRRSLCGASCAPPFREVFASVLLRALRTTSFPVAVARGLAVTPVADCTLRLATIDVRAAVLVRMNRRGVRRLHRASRQHHRTRLTRTGPVAQRSASRAPLTLAADFARAIINPIVRDKLAALVEVVIDHDCPRLLARSRRACSRFDVRFCVAAHAIEHVVLPPCRLLRRY